MRLIKEIFWDNKYKIGKLSKTYRTDKELSKALSDAIINGVCPWCEFAKLCCIDRRKWARLCIWKSTTSHNVWVRITDARKVVSVGNRYGQLAVIDLHGYDNSGNQNWLCRCTCGEKKVIRGDNLLSGNTTSCGCGRGGDRRSAEFQSRGTPVLLVRERKYTKGSMVNPDRSKHVLATEHSSRVGCVVPGPNGEPLKCCECHNLSRYSQDGNKTCEACGLIHDDLMLKDPEPLDHIGNTYMYDNARDWPLLYDRIYEDFQRCKREIDEKNRQRMAIMSDYIDEMNREYGSCPIDNNKKPIILDDPKVVADSWEGKAKMPEWLKTPRLSSNWLPGPTA